MKSEVISSAILAALSLLKNEVQTVDLRDLREEYLSVIEQLEAAFEEIKQDE